MKERLTVTRGSRFIFLFVAGLFVVCVTAQIFIAGMAIFTDSSYWHSHIVFVRIFELFPILMLILAFVGKLPVFLRWMSVLILVMIFAQYFTANFEGAGALHPVIAAVLFWVSIVVAVQAKRSIFPKNEHVQSKEAEIQ
ncbi:DUF6220 domain-containing protein [Paenibacillus allorhizosphaerae]|uniref:Uncharacterized protein n=1 Tax=Paenibacillus allorhizosphaerae TaxID=2849866 RepID=A0ABM8VUF2_9BACL|nr:DUF6220 domain-containing protein [Paenibacillus allorhizosphaerae]CAG7658713.1 hypothetical protein PAECIP111802_07140 [Paenibacillus allorhizosphaerae]